jgi:hypothetical protein
MPIQMHEPRYVRDGHGTAQPADLHRKPQCVLLCRRDQTSIAELCCLTEIRASRSSRHTSCRSRDASQNRDRPPGRRIPDTRRQRLS